jgi:hypothetical protein
MSYENTRCPCGDCKPTDTMLCGDCETHLKDHKSMQAFRDGSAPVEYRRHAAITLLSLARGRKRRQHFVRNIQTNQQQEET